MLILKEIIHRKFNFLMGLLGMIIIVAFVVSFYTITQATKNETRLLTRNMGFNVRIIPGETDMNQFWTGGYSKLTMSQDIVKRLIDEKSVDYAHLTATLHKKIIWRDKEVILTGISKDEKEPSGKSKSKMIFAIEKDKIYVGYELAKQFHLTDGDRLEFIGQTFEVKKTLSETGSEDDVRVYFDLETLQKLLNMEGRINEVMALNCMCSTQGGDPLGELRAELNRVVPEAKVIMNATIANAREDQRKMTDKYFAFLFPIILIISAIWLASVAMTNVKERTHEIGIMKALGFTNWKISQLFFFRAFVIGLLGAILGFVLGSILSYYLGPKIFNLTLIPVKPLYHLLYWAIFIGPLFAALTSLIPVLWAVDQDSAQLLKEQ